MKSQKNCFVFPENAGFLHSLADFVLKAYPSTQYTKILILLPNRRSCRSLREAFLDITAGKPLLLPKIKPIGEIDEEDFFVDIENFNIPATQLVDKMRRQFLLMRLIMQFGNHQSGGGAVKQAVELARQLARLLDEVNSEGLDFSRLDKLAPENLSEHWQKTLDFLTIISRQWPKLLEEEGASDIITHRNQMLYALCEMWQNSPPDYPVIAAGSTGSKPATAALLKTIASLPNGKVIMPFLDKDMPEKQWQQVGETHPQYGLKKLLEKMEVEREEIKYLQAHSNSDDDKKKYIRSIFAPEEATADWAKAELPSAETLSNIKLAEADTLLDEARIIAVAMREVLEQKEKTAALVTPDRTLARLVSAQLKRFGIIVDDSAGRPLNTSPPACFLRLVLEMVASRFAPANILAVLRHPLAASCINTAKCRILSRELELSLLRGTRRGDGISGLLNAAIHNKKISNDLITLLTKLEEKSLEFSELFAPHKNANLKQLLSAHIYFAEWLAGSDEESGTQRLWEGEAGNALGEVIAGWNAQADILPPIDALTYPALFDSLLATEIYHSQIGLHPRLHILSPMEARLQRYDLVIMGSLNEGTWPQTSKPDPWMSRPQRLEFGLPSQQREIGQSAHDFVMQLYSPEVLLTRARKVDGTPTTKSRWWVRLQTLLAGREPDFFASMNQENYFAAAKNILEKPQELLALDAPAPVPPLASRPRKMRVTDIDNWLRDPYSIYAKYILSLRKLEKIDKEPDAADFGNLVHKALEIFVSEFPSDFPEHIDMHAKLLEAGHKAFADFLDRPVVATLWWSRFEVIAGWLVGEEKLRRLTIENIYAEVEASWNFTVDGTPFTLNTRIDRLEKLKSGTYQIIDYKTGAIPSKSDRERGLANQLPLEALIVEKGSPQDDKNVTQMEYWKLAGTEDRCDASIVESDINETKERLENLIRHFDNPETPYTTPTDSSLIRNKDYEHLVRRKEWELV